MNFKTILANVNGDSYFCHQIVESTFPNQRKVFYRKDDTLVVYSEKGPNSPYTSEVYILETCEFNVEDLTKNLNKMFRLLVNPVKRIDSKYDKVNNDDLKEWLERKFEEIGCSLKSHVVTRSGWDIFYRATGNMKISMYCREVIGTLEINNVKLFKEKYFQGMGQGKAFGYGLVQMLN